MSDGCDAQTTVKINFCRSNEWRLLRRLETGEDVPEFGVVQVAVTSLYASTRKLLLRLGGGQYRDVSAAIIYAADYTLAPSCLQAHGWLTLTIDAVQPTTHAVVQALHRLVTAIDKRRAEYLQSSAATGDAEIPAEAVIEVEFKRSRGWLQRQRAAGMPVTNSGCVRVTPSKLPKRVRDIIYHIGRGRPCDLIGGIGYNEDYEIQQHGQPRKYAEPIIIDALVPTRKEIASAIMAAVVRIRQMRITREQPTGETCDGRAQGQERGSATLQTETPDPPETVPEVPATEITKLVAERDAAATQNAILARFIRCIPDDAFCRALIGYAGKFHPISPATAAEEVKVAAGE